MVVKSWNGLKRNECMGTWEHGCMDAWVHDTCNHAVMQLPQHSFRHSREVDQLQKFLLFHCFYKMRNGSANCGMSVQMKESLQKFEGTLNKPRDWLHKLEKLLEEAEETGNNMTTK
jgi:predicted phosphoadenosine phosphosulfate sulfurtransferase